MVWEAQKNLSLTIIQGWGGWRWICHMVTGAGICHGIYTGSGHCFSKCWGCWRWLFHRCLICSLFFQKYHWLWQLLELSNRPVPGQLRRGTRNALVLGVIGTPCFTLHSSSALWEASVGVPLNPSPPGHELIQGMQRLNELEGELAVGHILVGAAKCLNVLSCMASDGGRDLSCRTLTHPWWRPVSLLHAGTLGWLRAPEVGSWGGGSARRCQELSPAELTAPLLSPQGGNACLQLQQPGPAATAAHILLGSSRSPQSGGPWSPSTAGSSGMASGFSLWGQGRGHQGQEMLLARVGTSSLAPLQHHWVFLPLAVPWGGSWWCPQPCFCISVPTLLMLVSPWVPLLGHWCTSARLGGKSALLWYVHNRSQDLLLT